jgi:AcrR family transcriptional regulator
METVSKQELRTKETRARLLDAAQEVFLRDGYESAQLDEIAATAGRSKGAVYTHFKSKEDLFLVLYEHRTRSYIDRLATSLQSCTNRKESLEAFREFYVGLVQDRMWPTLTLEFKLYALRHPESKERLRKGLELPKPTNDDAFYKKLFGQLTQDKRRDNDLSLIALGPIISGLVLESHFEPDRLTEKALRRILGRIFDALFAGRSRQL